MSSGIDSIDAMIKNLKDAKRNINKIVINLVVVHKDTVIGLMTDDQLYTKGVNRLGVRIRPQYTNYTIFVKTNKSPRQPTDRVTLKDTGDFYRSIKIRKQKTQFTLIATDPKTRGLIEKYGEEIIGLTKKNIENVGQIILPDLQRIVGKIIL